LTQPNSHIVKKIKGNELNTLIVILNYGSLILLSFITLFNPLRVKKKADCWFEAFIFLWSTFWYDEILHLTGTHIAIRHFSVLVNFMQFFTPVVFYISIIYFTNPNFKFKAADLKYLILPASYLILIVMQQSADEENQKLYKLFSLILILIQVILYIAFAYFKIRKHQKKIMLFASDTNEIDLTWLEYI
jgi:hypothetical protein